MAQVVFDPAGFKIRYPEFAAVSDPTLQAYFDEATLYLSNADNSPVQDLTRRKLFLNMLTAHVAALGGALTGGGAAAVGRTANATEGSVSVALEYSSDNAAAWYNQTQYGASYWQATLNLRRFRYIPGRTVIR